MPPPSHESPAAREGAIWAVLGKHGSKSAHFTREAAERHIADRAEPEKFHIVEYMPLAYSAELRAEIRDICEALNLPVQANEIDVRNVARAKAKEAVTNAEKYFNLYAAAERSLLQAREALEAANCILWMAENYAEGGGSNSQEMQDYKIAAKKITEFLASTSAPKGEAAK